MLTVPTRPFTFAPVACAPVRLSALKLWVLKEALSRILREPLLDIEFQRISEEAYADCDRERTNEYTPSEGP